MKVIKIMNEAAQWGVIGLIVWLLLGLDFDFLKEYPKKISTLESQVTEQMNKINSLEKQITDINYKLQSVATVDDLKNLQYESEKLEATAILSNEEAYVTSEISLLADYYNKNDIWINLVAAGILTILFLVLVSRKKTNPKTKAPVTSIASATKSESALRECA